MTYVAELWLATPVEPWKRLGFGVSLEGTLDLAGLRLRFVDMVTPPAVTGWTLVCDDDIDFVDGIPTRTVSEMPQLDASNDPMGVVAIDHVVIATGALERTCGAIESLLGLPLKRVRDAGHGVRQGFHRAGSVIIEVVEQPGIAADAPATLWGLVFNVRDLDAVVSWLGPDAIGAAKDAVQPGRRIATVRADAGLGVPLALMTP